MQTKLPYLLISVTSRRNTAEWRCGEALLSGLAHCDERLAPQYMGNFEPINQPINATEDCESVWAPVNTMRLPSGPFEYYSEFLWKRKKAVKGYGHVMHPKTDINGKTISAEVLFRAECDRKVRWLDVFEMFCSVLTPKYAMLHCFTEREYVRAEMKSPVFSFQNGPAEWALTKGIPNLAWGNYFGDEFAQEVDFDRLIANGYGVKKVGEGYIVTVTDNVLDLLDNFDRFSERRAALRKLFRPGFVQIPEENPGEEWAVAPA